MPPLRSILACATVALGTTGTIAAAPAVQEQEARNGDRLVKVELLADRAALLPGETFTIAVKLAVESGWHIYWENPGDSGLKTRFELRGPEGFEIGEPRFPTPEREVAAGEIVTYVHKGDVYFLAEVRAPRGLSAGSEGPAVFEVEARWLACIEACYPGSGRARLEVPLARGPAGPSPAHEKVFAAARARLPRPWKELEDAGVSASGSGARRSVRISVPQAETLEFFPSPSEFTTLEARSVTKDDRSCRLTAEIRLREPSPPESARLQGVLVVRKAAGHSSFLVDIDLAAPGSGK